MTVRTSLLAHDASLRIGRRGRTCFLFTAYPTAGTVATLSGVGNPAVIIVGLILLIFIRGGTAATTQPDVTIGGLVDRRP
jgi:hypothetical protein